MAQVYISELEESEFSGITFTAYAEVGDYDPAYDDLSNAIPSDGFEWRMFDDLNEALAYARAGKWEELSAKCDYYQRSGLVVWIDVNYWEYGTFLACHTLIACFWHDGMRDDREVSLEAIKALEN